MYKVNRSSLRLLGIFIFILTTVCIARERVAKIFSMKGEILLKQVKDTTWQAASVGQWLHTGDSLKVEKDANAYVVYVRGKQIHLEAGQTYQVHPPAPQPSQTWLKRMMSSIFSQEKPMERGSSRGSLLKLIYARNGKLLSTRLTFQWSIPASSGQYRLLLKSVSEENCEDDAGETVWEMQVTGTVADDAGDTSSLKHKTVFDENIVSLDYPEKFSPLMPGATYRLELIQEKPGWDIDIPACFTVATIAESAQIMDSLAIIKTLYGTEDSGNITEAVVAAAFLAERTFYTDALIRLQKAYRNAPDNPVLKTALANLCIKAGLAEWAASFLNGPERSKN